MKSKDLVKEYCSKETKHIVLICCLGVLSVALLIAPAIFAKYILDIFESIRANSVLVESNKLLIAKLTALTDPAVEATIQELIVTNAALIKNIDDSIVAEIILVISFCVVLGLTFYVNLMLDKTVSKLGSVITNNLRKDTYQALLRGEYYEIQALKTEDVTNAIVNETEVIGNRYVSNHFFRLFYKAFTFLACFILLFCFNVTCGIIALVSIPMIYLGLTYIGKIVAKKNKNYDDLNNTELETIRSNIDNLKSIKIRNGIEHEEETYKELSNKINKEYDSKYFLASFKNRHMLKIFNYIVLIVYSCVVAGFVANGQDVKLGTIVGVILLVPVLYKEFHELIETYLDKPSVSQAYSMVDSILDIRPESRSETITSLDEIQTLSFNNVSYDYNATSQGGIDKVSFEIKKGEKIGIFGYQKSGKTTIVDLLAKIIRPRFGNVLINNCDINKLNTSYLRNLVAYVPQNFRLFDGTIEENITYPMPLDEYKYNDALNKCKLKTLLMNLPKRDQENVNNVKLSPADIERIGLAYALYKDSPIIILDEATSKLDQTTENEIMSEFYKLKNKITIVVSNRIDALSKCDKMIILNAGKVIEYGKTEELMQNSRSAYSKIRSDAERRSI